MQIATDGINYLDDHDVYLTINTEMVKHLPGFKSYTDKDIRDVKIHYLDIDTNESILESENYRAYDPFKTDYFGIGPKTIEGYQLVESPRLGDMVVVQKEIIYKYRKLLDYKIVNNRKDLLSLVENMEKVRENEAYIYDIKANKDSFDKSIDDANFILSLDDNNSKWQEEEIKFISENIIKAYKALDGHKPNPNTDNLYNTIRRIESIMYSDLYHKFSEEDKKELEDIYKQIIGIHNDPKAIIAEIKKMDRGVIQTMIKFDRLMSKYTIEDCLDRAELVFSLEEYKQLEQSNRDRLEDKVKLAKTIKDSSYTTQEINTITADLGKTLKEIEDKLNLNNPDKIKLKNLYDMAEKMKTSQAYLDGKKENKDKFNRLLEEIKDLLNKNFIDSKTLLKLEKELYTLGEILLDTSNDIVVGESGNKEQGGTNIVTPDDKDDKEENPYPLLKIKNRPFMKGVSTNKFAPKKNITRAEVAAIFARLMALESEIQSFSKTEFKDLENKWYLAYISYLEQYEILNGYKDGSFRPEADITRAEFLSIIAKFDKLEESNHKFTDVNENHWAKKSIDSAYVKGIINGYPDGSFRPDESITREEVACVINKLLKREPNIELIDSRDKNPYSDINKNDWSYYHILEASKSY